jgi:hypothetical protein
MSARGTILWVILGSCAPGVVLATTDASVPREQDTIETCVPVAWDSVGTIDAPRTVMLDASDVVAAHAGVPTSGTVAIDLHAGRTVMESERFMYALSNDIWQPLSVVEDAEPDGSLRLAGHFVVRDAAAWRVPATIRFAHGGGLPVAASRVCLRLTFDTSASVSDAGLVPTGPDAAAPDVGSAPPQRPDALPADGSPMPPGTIRDAGPGDGTDAAHVLPGSRPLDNAGRGCAAASSSVEPSRSPWTLAAVGLLAARSAVRRRQPSKRGRP